MRAIQLQATGGLDGLVMTELPQPRPGPGQIVVRVRAVSLNYRDYAIARGVYGNFPLPLVPCSDAAGEVVQIGSGVTRWQVGDRVSPHYVVDWIAGPPRAGVTRRRLGGPLPGVLAEYVCVDESAAVAPPRHLDFGEACTLPIAGVTAWHALFVAGRTQPGDTVVVQGTGGVSTFALLLARLAGARVIATSGSDEKLARAAALGAWQGINYRATPAWHEAVLEATGGRGADHVVEVAGGANVSRSIAAVRVGGRISLVGFLEGMRAEVDLPLAFSRAVTLACVSVGSRSSYEALVRALEGGGVHPVVDRRFAFDDYRAAFEHLATGRHQGKVVITLD